MKLDEYDIAILRELQQDGKLTNKQLSERVHLTPTPVYERVKKLEKLGFIKGYVAILDESKLYRALTVFCHIKLKQHTKEIGIQFVREIMAIKEVTECYNTSGEYDFLLKVMVADMAGYQEFVLQGLGEMSNIGSTHSIFVMGTIKDAQGIPL